MVDKKLINYLEQVSLLESQKHTLEEIKEELYSIYIRILHDKKAEYVDKLSFEDEYRHVKNKDAYCITGMLLNGIFVVLLFLIGITQNMTIALYWLLSFVAILIRFFGVIIYAYVKCYKQNEKADLEMCNIKKYNVNVDKLATKCESEIHKFASLIVKKDDALKKLYSCGVLHKNYCNFYSVCKIYELLDTGICDDLHGFKWRIFADEI